MSSKPSQKSLSYVVYNGVATTVMDTFAVGAPLIAYAKLLGAGNIVFSILNSIPYFGNLFHLLAAWLLIKGYSVRSLSVLTTLVSRPFYLLMALLVFVQNVTCALVLLVFFLCCCYFVGCISGGCWMPWMKALIPEQNMGIFFAHRFKCMQLTKIICFFSSALALKYVQNYFPAYEVYAYAFLFFISFIAGLYGVYTLQQIEDKNINVDKHIPFLKQVLLSLQSRPFCLLLSVLSVLNFGFAFFVPFVAVFMLNQLNIPLSTVLFLSLISQISYVFFIKKIGVLSDNFGSFYSLFVSIFLILFLVLGFWGTNSLYAPQWVMMGVLVVLHIVLGCATATFNLGLNNVSLVCTPDRMSVIYFSVNSIFKSIAGAFGALSSGVVLIVGAFVEKNSEFFTISSWSIFFIVALCIETLGLILLKFSQKTILLWSHQK